MTRRNQNQHHEANIETRKYTHKEVGVERRDDDQDECSTDELNQVACKGVLLSLFSTRKAGRVSYVHGPNESSRMYVHSSRLGKE